MSEIDIKALEANFENWKKERAPDETTGVAFERYAIEQVVKDADLSDEEIESGNFGGGDDGGVDGMYFFINRTLMMEETEVPDPALSAQLVLIQAKYEKSFTEEAVEKIARFTKDLLDYSVPVAQLTYLNALAREGIARFRAKYESILGSQHSLSVDFHYACKTDNPPHSKIIKRVEMLKGYVNQQLSAATVNFEFWDSRRLLTAARTSPKTQLVLEMTNHFGTADDAAVVCLVKLSNLAAFLRDDHGELRRPILEPNVRDYQGKRNPVNADIRATLEDQDIKEFWWLNNGITLLASQYSITGNKLTVVNPGIVNGLQTSQEVFSYFSPKPTKEDNRNVLIRVIIPPDEQIRNRIIKATNFQTTVDPVSLHATDQIHFDIEERLRLYKLYYDRRKGEYRNLRKRISSIISILSLSRAVIAIVLREPNSARARPQTVLRKEQKYKEVFNTTYNRDLYVTCILLDRQVEEFLKEQTFALPETRRDIRFYLDMWISCILANKSNPGHQEIAALLPKVSNPIDSAIMKEAFDSCLKLYQDLGGTDVVAKGDKMRLELFQVIYKRVNPQKPEQVK